MMNVKVLYLYGGELSFFDSVVEVKIHHEEGKIEIKCECDKFGNYVNVSIPMENVIGMEVL